jgi:hypothetical protein
MTACQAGSKGGRRWIGACCVAASLVASGAQAAIGDRLAIARGHPFFKLFQLFETDRRPLMADGRLVTLAPPPLSRASGRVAVRIATGPGDRILEMELRLRRSFIDGKDGLHARDITRHLLFEAGPDLDRDDLLPYIAALETAGPMVGMVGPPIVGADVLARPETLPAGPGEPGTPQAPEVTPSAATGPHGPLAATREDADDALAVFLNHRTQFVQTGNWTRVVFENVVRADGPWLLVTVAARSSLVGTSILPQPIPLGAGVTHDGMPALPPAVLPPGPTGVQPPQPDAIAVAVANVDPGLNLAEDPERPAYLAAFLDASDLPDMTQVRDTRLQGPDLADVAFDANHGDWAGDALWIGTNHDPVWRVLDARWTFLTVDDADAYFDAIRDQTAAGLPRIDGLPAAGDRAVVHLGYTRGLVPLPTRRSVVLFRVGRVVCRLEVVEGPDARVQLRPETVALLARRIEARIHAVMP